MDCNSGGGTQCYFAAAVFYVFLKVGNEPTALIVAWFAFTTGELMALAMIRNKEVGKEGACEPTETDTDTK